MVSFLSNKALSLGFRKAVLGGDLRMHESVLCARLNSKLPH